VQIVDGEVIEQQLAMAFPSLSQAQLVALTHQVNPDKYQPGEIILQQGTPVENFHVINKGLVEVIVAEPGGAQKVVATLKHGDYFGEIELLKGGTSVATVRAAGNSTVELLRLGRDAFRGMVEQSAEFRAAITRVRQTRIAEHLAASGGMAV
jgi:CRP-like cAMP-binding protein